MVFGRRQVQCSTGVKTRFSGVSSLFITQLPKDYEPQHFLRLLARSSGRPQRQPLGRSRPPNAFQDHATSPRAVMPRRRQQNQATQASKAPYGEPSWETMSAHLIRPPRPHGRLPPPFPSPNSREPYQRLQREMLWNPADRRILTPSAASPASRARPLKACPITRASARPHHMPSANCHLSASLTSRPREAGARWHHLRCAWLWKTCWRSREAAAALGREGGC